jgi:hypothetical protein
MIDLTPYKSSPDQALGYQPLAVGWLQRNRPFPTGKSSVEFEQKLLAFCFEEHTVNQVRAVSRCAVGDNCPRLLPPVESDGRVAHFGSSEIRVVGANEIYAAPTLIYHYVTAHNYRPPDEFIAAVLTGPAPGSPEHRVLVQTLRRG